MFERIRLSYQRLIFVGFVVAVSSFILSQPTPAVEDGIPVQPHPLPTSLAKWHQTQSGDYFDQIEAPKVGHLIWSEFPIKVYIEESGSYQASSWYREVSAAVEDWNAYLPLEIVQDFNFADIQIFRRRPPLEPGNLRASSAETRYQVFVRQLDDGTQMLSHRFIIWLSPTQTGKYVTSAALHELGHALGIWGHSQTQTDVMYFAQVREPPPISARDVNTLKRIYSQPTRLGWRVLSKKGERIINFREQLNGIIVSVQLKSRNIDLS